MVAEVTQSLKFITAPYLSSVRIASTIIFSSAITSRNSHQRGHEHKEQADADRYYEVVVNRRVEFDDTGTDGCHHSTRKGEEREKTQYGHGYAGEGPLPGLPVVDAVPAKANTGKRGNAVKDCKGNEGRNDYGDRKQDDAGKGAYAKEERSLPWQGIRAISVLHERRQERDSVPPEDKVDKDHTCQEGSCNDRDDRDMVKKEDQPGNAKTKTEMDKLTDDLPHDDIP